MPTRRVSMMSSEAPPQSQSPSTRLGKPGPPAALRTVAGSAVVAEERGRGLSRPCASAPDRCGSRSIGIPSIALRPRSARALGGQRSASSTVSSDRSREDPGVGGHQRPGRHHDPVDQRPDMRDADGPPDGRGTPVLSSVMPFHSWPVVWCPVSGSRSFTDMGRPRRPECSWRRVSKRGPSEGQKA